MTLDPTLSLAVLALLGLFLAVSVMRSIAKVMKRVLQVGLVVAILARSGVLQLPAGMPGIADVVGTFEPSLIGFVTGATVSANGMNMSDAVNASSTSLPLQQLIDTLKSLFADAANGT